jgi:hypothetical protein
MLLYPCKNALNTAVSSCGCLYCCQMQCFEALPGKLFISLTKSRTHSNKEGVNPCHSCASRVSDASREFCISLIRAEVQNSEIIKRTPFLILAIGIQKLRSTRYYQGGVNMYTLRCSFINIPAYLCTLKSKWLLAGHHRLLVERAGLGSLTQDQLLKHLLDTEYKKDAQVANAHLNNLRRENNRAAYHFHRNVVKSIMIRVCCPIFNM